MKYILIKLIKLYQTLLSPEKSVWVKIGVKKYKHTCPFHPTCSEYFIQAIEKYGVLKGSFLGIKRILHCHPGAKPKIDLCP
ncbi:membrane protein insertion efficiency factor YidD [Patescibacteria group bacterium]